LAWAAGEGVGATVQAPWSARPMIAKPIARLI
jgi:hypothetical protein